MKRWRSSYVADGLLLVALCLLFFWRDLTSVAANHRSFAAGDFANQFFAFARYEASRLQNGALPLWNPYTYAGHPFLADVQSAVFYPLSLLTILLTSWSGLTYAALELEALVHFPLVAVTTYLLARRLTGSRGGGIVAAVIFTFSGYLTGYPPLQLAVLEVQAWLPLILLCLLVAAERFAAGKAWAAARWTLGAGLCLGLSTLAGHPQSSLLVIYGSLGFGLFVLWPRPLTTAARAWLPRVGLLALFAVVGIGLAAVQLVPSWEFMRLASRASIGFEEAGAGFTSYDLLQLVLPQVGVPVPALYVGILPLGLAASALVRAQRCEDIVTPAARRMVAFLGWGALLSLVLSFGQNLPLYGLFYNLVPGWQLFRHQERDIVWAVLAVALLAGYGAAWLASRRERPQRWLVRGFGFASLAALILALAFFAGYQAGKQELWGFTAAALFLAFLAGLAALTTYSASPLLIVGLIVLDLFTLNSGNHAGPAGWADPFPAQPLLAAPLADRDVFRMANEDRLPGNYGDAYGLEDIGGASPLRLERYRQLVEDLPRTRAWQLLNVKYVLSARQSLEVPAERLAEAPGKDGQTTYLYKLAERAPRAWLAGQALVEPDETRLWQKLGSAEFDPAHQVLLAAAPPGFQPADGCAGTLDWQSRQPERLALRVTSQQPCVLVLSELDYPGWQASVDGAGAAILRADGLLRGLALGPGTHQVVFAFRPASLTLGAAVSIGTGILALLGWLLLGRRVRVQESPTE